MNLTAILQMMQLVFGLLPTIFTAVRAVEAALPSAPGKTKFDAVMGTVEGVYNAAGQALPAFTTAASAIGAAVNTAVAALNATGEFTKSTPAPAGTTSAA